MDSPTLAGKRVVLFSYGSGLASAMYSLRVTSDPKLLSRLVSTLTDISERLASRKVVQPADFEQTMRLREDTHHLAPYTPVSDPTELCPGTYYLAAVDDMHRRVYKRIAPSNRSCTEGLKSPLAETAGLSNGTE